MTRRLFTLQSYAAAVTAVGIVSLALVAAFGDAHGVSKHLPELCVFSVCLMVGEVFAISVPLRGGKVDEVTTSTMFTFALLLAFGTPVAVLVQIVVSVAADVFYRKPTWKISFNAGQYAIAVGAAGGVYGVLGGGVPLSGSSLGPFVAAALAFYLLNTVLADVAIALTTGIAVLPYLARDLVFQTYVTPPLLALSPVVVVVADRSLWLIPLLGAPAVAVYRGTQLALENTRLVTKLRENLDKMTELNRVKDDFIAVVSHELRTPLTSIQGYVKTLLQLSPDLGEEQRRSFLEAADRQSERLRRLIEQLLVVARLESHVEPLVVSRVSLSRLAALVLDELRPRGHGHAFDVRVEAAADEIDTDENKVHQILSNLVENALKYSPPDTRVTIASEPSLNGVLVTVMDEGPGVPPEAQERIFERFYQVDSSATRRVGGTGLGLYICRKMATAAGARLWLARSDPTGSEFCLFLPQTPPANEDADDATGERAGPIDQSITARV